jgi:hypothetical protein
VITVSNGDYLWFVDLAIDQMVAILRHLGDDAANQRPDLEGANAPYAVLTHCLGVLEYWGGHMVAGRTIVRDRDAEFVASGPVEELVERTARARRQLESDIDEVEPTARPRGARDPEDDDIPLGQSQGGVLLHILEELFQHLGQMELTRDVIDAR